PPRSTLFPYTTLFRSDKGLALVVGGNELGEGVPAHQFGGNRRIAGIELRREVHARGGSGGSDERLFHRPARGMHGLGPAFPGIRSEEHTSELQSRENL